MIKTDNRHYNRKAKRGLALDLELWLAFVDNNKQPIKIMVAHSPARKGLRPEDYFLWYDGNEKDKEFHLLSEHGIMDYSIKTDSIEKAKRLLKEWDSQAKWKWL